MNLLKTTTVCYLIYLCLTVEKEEEKEKEEKEEEKKQNGLSDEDYQTSTHIVTFQSLRSQFVRLMCISEFKSPPHGQRV